MKIIMKIAIVLLFLLAVSIPLAIMFIPVLPVIPEDQRISGIYMCATVPVGGLFYFSFKSEIIRLWVIIESWF